MAWLLLIVAGLLEVAWAFFLKQSQGFSNIGYTIAFAVTAVLSFVLLSQALKDLPIGTGYAVWTGIGAAGTAVVGMVVLGESREIAKIVSLVLLVAGIVGLQLSGSH